MKVALIGGTGYVGSYLIDELIKKLQPLGLASASRTGIVAMTKGAEVFNQRKRKLL